MKTGVLACMILALAMEARAQPSPEGAVAKIAAAATNSNFAYQRLATLCDTFGPRFSGTTNLEQAIDWILGEMKRDGLDNPHGEPVLVPRWVRGEESAELIHPRAKSLSMLGLGGSIGTKPGGITAEVLVVTNFQDLEVRASEAQGRIVLFNQPFTDYDSTVVIRREGASRASKAGAVASLIRSVTPVSLNTPHTGMMRYQDAFPAIPHAAITVEDSELLQRFQDRGIRPRIRLEMSARTLGESESRNVVAEWRGREKPDEIVVLGGHIDSWDVGQGALDDGGGCMIAWEAVRLLKELNLRPRRTVRVVLWTNEENGLAGARAYEKAHARELGKHVLAFEADEGCFNPIAFGFDGSDAALLELQKFLPHLRGLGVREIARGGLEADIAGLAETGIPSVGLRVDGGKYFWYHHTQADTIDKIDPAALSRCIAATAILGYLVAERAERLPR